MSLGSSDRSFGTSLVALFIALALTSDCHAVILPYTVRTRDYSSWTPATHGGINTIGMAGATLAVPNSISAAEANPAGFAVLTGTVAGQLSKIEFADKALQRTGEAVHTDQWGMSISPGHWGLSLAYYTPQIESGIYASPNTGDTAKTEVSLKELRLTAARAFFDDALSLGSTLEVLKAVRELNEGKANRLGLSYRLGVLYRLPRHILLGASFSPQASVGPAKNPDPQAEMPGFNRSVMRPLQAGMGFGWIPNRFFKCGLSLTYVARTRDTALLGDQNVTTGAKATWVPRLGASYVVGEFTNVKMITSGGAYYDVARLSNGTNRLHLTAGFEVNPYFVNVGAGFDISPGYRALVVSIGVDVVRAARAFSIIPEDPLPPYQGLWPRVLDISADGLPIGLTSSEERTYLPPNPKQVQEIAIDIPSNIVKKVTGEKTTVEEKKAKAKTRRKGKSVPTVIPADPVPMPSPSPS